MDKKYNGWTNYATWRINLEIFDNLELTDFMTPDEAIDLQFEEPDHNNDELIEQLATDMVDSLREYVENILQEQSNQGDSGTNLTLDYAMAFINDVNWYEIAESMARDYIDNLND